MGFPTYAGAGQSARNAGAAVTGPTYPPGAPAGGLYVLQVAHRNIAAGLAATLSVTTAWNPVAVLTNASSRQWVFYRYATGAETNTTTVQFVGAGTYTNQSQIHLVLSVTASAVIESINTVIGAAATNRTDAAVTPTGPSRLALNFLFNNNAVDIGAFQGATGGTWTVGSSVTNVGDCRIGVEIASLTSATTIDGGVLTLTAGIWSCIGFALKPIDTATQLTITAAGLVASAAYGSPRISPTSKAPGVAAAASFGSPTVTLPTSALTIPVPGHAAAATFGAIATISPQGFALEGLDAFGSLDTITISLDEADDMANDFIRIDLDTNPGEPPRSLYNCVKRLREAREEVNKVRDWMLHSTSLSGSTVAMAARFGIPAGTGGAVFTLLDGTLQVMDGTSSGYMDELLARLGNSSS